MLPVIEAYTVVDVGAVMVEHQDATIADAAVFGAQRLDGATSVTETTQT